MKKIFSKRLVKITAGILIIAVIGLALYNSPIVQNKTSVSNVVQKTAVVKKGDIKLLVSGTGQVYYDKTSSVASQVSSKVADIFFKEGDSVKAGDLICQFDDSTAQLNLNQIKNSLVENQLADNNNEIQTGKLAIKTPFSGQISDIAVKQGDVVQKDGPLFTIADTSKLKLTVEFNAADIDKISLNQAVNVDISSLMQSTQGIVTYKSSKAISTISGGMLYTVEIQINNPGGLTEGMKASASIDTSNENLSSTDTGTLECINKTTVVSETGGTVNSISIKKNQQVDAGEEVIDMKNDDITINKSISDAKITDSQNQIASSENQLGNYKIYAPIDGTISKLNIKKGDSVIVGEAITTIENKNIVQVDVNIDELDIPKVSIGQKAQLVVDAIPETTTNPIEGEVVKIATDGISKNGVTSFAVTIKVNERQNLLKSGMNLTGNIESGSTAKVLYLPKEAISESEGKSIVMVKDGQNKATQKVVEVGVTNGSIVEITSGLKEGDTVILPQNK